MTGGCSREVKAMGSRLDSESRRCNNIQFSGMSCLICIIPWNRKQHMLLHWCRERGHHPNEWKYSQTRARAVWKQYSLTMTLNNNLCLWHSLQGDAQNNGEPVEADYHVDHKWNIYGDLKVNKPLLGMQLGNTKHICLLCLWNNQLTSELVRLSATAMSTGDLPWAQPPNGTRGTHHPNFWENAFGPPNF